MNIVAMLAIGLALAASPAAAAPFAYVANAGSNNVSVIDTATNMVVATVPVGTRPSGVAVTPDVKHVYVTGSVVSVIDTASNTVVATIPVSGRGVALTPDGTHAYVANEGANTDSVIDTATNTVLTGTGLPIPVGSGPFGVAITPDGKHAYVTNLLSNNVSVIDTASNTMAATVPVGGVPYGVAVTPDGKHAYVTISPIGVSNNVSVIDTASNTVVATVPVGTGPIAVAVTPDGNHAYVANAGTPIASSNVSVIATATNTVVATVPVGLNPDGVAVTPDGTHAYVANENFGRIPGDVSVIDTATNMVVGTTIPVGIGPVAVGIVPPPRCVPFIAFNALLEIDLDRAPKKDAFALESSFTLSSAASIDPVTEPVTLQIGTFTTTIPSGSFRKIGGGLFTFAGVSGGARLEALISPTGSSRYALVAAARDAKLTGAVSPVPVTLTIGDDCGTAPVQALIIH